MELILHDKQPNFGWAIKSTISSDYIIENGEFSLGKSYIKGLVCLLVSQDPRSFDKDRLVKIVKYLSKCCYYKLVKYA